MSQSALRQACYSRLSSGDELQSRIYESLAHKGQIPGYVRGANTKSLVRLFCKGKCGKVRWAEMAVDYPGKAALLRSQLLDFEATCLACGRVAFDPYNWYR
jgi:hypothetical protein